jgi:hypothetical protein
MNETKPQFELPDLGQFQENRRNFPPAELAPYYGKYVAWSPDGCRILASGHSMDEVEQHLIAAGIDPSQVVGSYVPPADLVLLL